MSPNKPPSEINTSRCCCLAAVSNSLRLHGLYLAGLLCPQDFPGMNTGVGCHFLRQGIFPDPGLEPVSSVSAGGFFTTESPGEYHNTSYLLVFDARGIKYALFDSTGRGLCSFLLVSSRQCPVCFSPWLLVSCLFAVTNVSYEYECDYLRSPVPPPVLLESTVVVDCKEIKPVNPKGNQPWIFIGRTDAEAEAPILRPPDAKSQLIGKDPGTEKDWGQEKRATEDETVRWHHWLNGHEFKQALGDGKGQRSGVCRSPWGSQRVGHDLGTQQQQSSLGDTSSLINQQKVTTADHLFPCATSSGKGSRRKRKRSPKRDCSLYLYSLYLSEFVFSHICHVTSSIDLHIHTYKQHI